MSISPFQPSEETHWQADIRRLELTRCAHVVHQLAAKIQLTEDFATGTPSLLARLISEIARILSDKLPVEVPSVELDTVNAFLEAITSHLRYVERARVSQTPWSIVQSAEKLLRVVAHPKSCFIVRPTWSYNYSLTGEFWGLYRRYLHNCSWFPLDELQNKVGFDNKQTIYCISFPRIERTNCLLHANWGHEVGHILAGRWVDTSFAGMWAASENAISSRIEEAIRKDPPPVDPLFKDMAIKQIVAQRIRTTMEVAHQGFTELLCDRIGAHLFGPAALAAAMEFAARFALDISPLQAGNYPPWRYRIRKMCEFCLPDLERDIQSNYPTSRMNLFFDWLQDATRLAACYSDQQVLKTAIETREAYAFIEGHWDSAVSQITSMLPNDLAEPYRLNGRHEQIDKLLARIEINVPPNEVGTPMGKPASLQDILTAGWVHKIALCSSAGSTKERMEKYDLLCRLILKACESSHVHAEWGEDIENMESL